ncbi:MAG TPA: HAD family hydrolase, partial [bacterium]|nr:HAD family hydrolase [bacterium]
MEKEELMILLLKLMKKNNIKAIIFDLDDTLYPEEQFVESGFRIVSKYISQKYKLNDGEVLNILKKDFKKGLRKKNFDVLLKKLNLKKINVQKLIKIYRNHYPSSIFLYPDVKKIFKKIKNKFKIGLITDGEKITQKNKIFVLGIEKYFDEILITSILGKKYFKPSKKAFELLLKKFKVLPKESVYIGDNSLKDFI